MALMPLWREVAKTLQNVGGLQVARFDGSQNELPGLGIDGYPTVVLYTNQSVKDGVRYTEQTATLEKFLEFVG